MLKFKKIVVGMSGGVDSAVTALLLKYKGYDIQGVFMKNWDIADEKGTCSADRDYNDAAEICDKLHIPLKEVNFVKQYWNEVFMNLINEYESGSTPNPDILCNRHVKFNYFYKYAMEVLQADAIATGHYARSSFGDYLQNYNKDEVVKLLRAKDTFKDQTFFLCQINQNALRRTMFPLGSLNKSEVKQIARNAGLDHVVEKKESMGICFIGSRNFQDFIGEYIDDKPGVFVDFDTGKIVGQHRGVHQWTVGQRSRVPGNAKPYFIARKDVDANVIYVAAGTDHPILYSALFFTDHPHWISEQPPTALQIGDEFCCDFTFQHTHDLVPCRLYQCSTGLGVLLEKSKRAITKGQYAVFYKGNVCLGGAVITHPGISNFSLKWLERNQNGDDVNLTHERV